MDWAQDVATEPPPSWMTKEQFIDHHIVAHNMCELEAGEIWQEAWDVLDSSVKDFENKKLWVRKIRMLEVDWTQSNGDEDSHVDQKEEPESPPKKRKTIESDGGEIDNVKKEKQEIVVSIGCA